MPTNYIKNFDHNQFQAIYQKLDSARVQTKPLWFGTIYVGKEPLYVECHVKWLADKIEDYFVKTLPNQHIAGAKELYVLNNGTNEFIPMPDSWTTNVFWTGNNIYCQPDLIAHFNCIFGKWDNKYIISVDESNPYNFYHLGENHLLMKLFGYIFDTKDNIILHSAAIGNNDFGVLITGLSGAGKSTLAAHCLKLGLKFISDDRVALHCEEGKVIANPIYTTISLLEHIDGLKVKTSVHSNNSTKDVIVLDKSHISESLTINAIIEPVKSNSDTPVLQKVPKAPVLTRICSDYSNFSLLTRSMNPLADYRKISDLFTNIDAFSLQLSNSVEDNAMAVFNFVTKGDVNV